MFLNNKNFFLEIVRINGLNLEFIPKIFKNDKEIVLTAIINNSNAFIFASDKLKDNKEIVLELINQCSLFFNVGNINFLQYISDRLKNDKEIILKAIQKNINAIVFASNELTKAIFSFFKSSNCFALGP